MPGNDGKPESTGNDPEQLTRLLELELMQKRSAWQQASARHRAIRSASFFFLFVVILAALVGFYLVFSRAPAEHGNQHATPTPASTR
jgi:hypothetical protein